MVFYNLGTAISVEIIAPQVPHVRYIDV